MTNQLHNQQRRTVDMRIPAIEKYAYCLCLHVKPTTIFIAVFKLIRALLFASILLNTEIAVNESPLNEYGFMTPNYAYRPRSTAIAADILRRVMMASVSAVGIYAVISGRAALLMPLYAVLLIDFFFTLPSFSSWDLDPSLSESLSEFKNISTINNAYTRYSFMLLAIVTEIVKIYFLCVVWKCYRYLRLIELVTPLRLSEIYPHIHQNVTQYPIVRVLGSGDSSDIVSGHNVGPPPYDSIASNMKPPNYEEAMKTSNMTLAINPSNPDSNNQQTIVMNTGINSNEQDQNVSGTQRINNPNQAPELSENVVVVVVALNSDGVSNNNGNINPNLSSSTSTESIQTITNNNNKNISQGPMQYPCHLQAPGNSEMKSANDIGTASNTRQRHSGLLENSSTTTAKPTLDVNNHHQVEDNNNHDKTQQQ